MQRLYKNKVVAIALILGLIGLNYLQWGGDDPVSVSATRNDHTSHTNSGLNNTGVGFSNTSQINFDELTLAKTQKTDKPSVKRDMFYPRIIKKPKPKKIVKARPIKKPKGPPPLTPEQIAQRTAKQQLEKVKLMGIMEEGGLRKAFIMYEDNSYIVSQGEGFATSFRLSQIKPTHIDVTETNTTLSRTIDITK